jgi:hypothetical protein
VPTVVGETYFVQIFHSFPTGTSPTFAADTYPGGIAYNNGVAFALRDAPLRIFTEPSIFGPPPDEEVIPEPSALALLGGGLAFLVVLGRRRSAGRS